MTVENYMAWNEPGNRGKDPWGNNGGGKKQGPPDLDDIFKNMMKRFGSGQQPSQGPSFNSKAILAGLGVLLVIWIFSGFYTIKEAERGVVLRFGKYSDEVDPGLHWKPTFLDKVIPVDISNTRTQPASGSMLTQDENVVRVEMEVQYRVTEPYKYLFSVTNANSSLREAMDSALRYVIGHNVMDDILTTGREKIRQDTWEELQRIIDPYQLGLTIVDVNFLPARPPEQVKEAFDDAISAQEDEERYIREAEAYAREREPKARGRVKRIEQEANAYKERVILEAQGKVARFEKLLPEYRLAPNVTRERLYLEAMAGVLSHTSKVLVDTKGNGNLIYLPLDKMMSSSGQSTASSRNTSLLTPSSESQPTPINSSSSTRPTRGERFSQGRN